MHDGGALNSAYKGSVSLFEPLSHSRKMVFSEWAVKVQMSSLLSHTNISETEPKDMPPTKVPHTDYLEYRA